MTLSILCVTNNEHPHVQRFILALHRLATVLGAELVLGLDREKAQRADWRKLANVAVNLQADKLQEDVLDQAVDACSGDYVLRIDDDEMVSPALEAWLAGGQYQFIGSRVYAFPRVYLWPDEHHILVNDGIYPDLQTRLGERFYMHGVNSVHAGNPNGTGQVIPYAIEHHSLLVKTYAERRAVAERYESLRPGAGFSRTYAKYLLPEDIYGNLTTKEYSDGDFAAR